MIKPKELANLSKEKVQKLSEQKKRKTYLENQLNVAKNKAQNFAHLTIAPVGEAIEQIRPFFKRQKELENILNTEFKGNSDTYNGRQTLFAKVGLMVIGFFMIGMVFGFDRVAEKIFDILVDDENEDILDIWGRLITFGVDIAIGFSLMHFFEEKFIKSDPTEDRRDVLLTIFVSSLALTLAIYIFLSFKG